MGLLDGLLKGLDPLGLFPGSPSGALIGDKGLLTNPTGAWDAFKNGQTNDVNYKIAQENLDYQRERNEIEDARYEEETAYNRAFAEEQRDYERAFNAEEQAYQRAFAEEERDYQRNFAEGEREYNRALQQTLFDREDTALERQASSLSKMGINPLSQQLNGLGAGSVVSSASPASSAAGSGVAAGASVPSTSARGGSALHNDFKMQDMGVLQALSPLASLANTMNQVATGQGQRDLLQTQIDKQKLDNFILAKENGIMPYEFKGFNYLNGQDISGGLFNRKNSEYFWKEMNSKNDYENKYKPDFARTMDYLVSDDFFKSAEKALTKGSELFDKALNKGLGEESNKFKFNPFSQFLNLFF